MASIVEWQSLRMQEYRYGILIGISRFFALFGVRRPLRFEPPAPAGEYDEAVHSDHPAVPAGLADALETARAELDDHLRKEEQVLFPAMQAGYSGSLDMPIRVMRQDHDGHGEIVRRLESLAHGFVPPEGACRSWQALYAGLEKFVTDLTEHIHLENNVLFPRFQRRWS